MAGGQKKVEQYLKVAAFMSDWTCHDLPKVRTSKAYFRPRKSLLAIWFSATPCISDREMDNWEDRSAACAFCSSVTKTMNCECCGKIGDETDDPLSPCLSRLLMSE